MDPTIHKIKEPSKKHKAKVLLEKITHLIWVIILIAIAIQIIFIAAKLLSNRPNERMCWDTSTCFNYCDYAKQRRCIVPDKKDSSTTQQAWQLLLTGKRNIVEILNDNQAYCACEYSVNEETRLETFYNFYLNN